MAVSDSDDDHAPSVLPTMRYDQSGPASTRAVRWTIKSVDAAVDGRVGVGMGVQVGGLPSHTTWPRYATSFTDGTMWDSYVAKPTIRPVNWTVSPTRICSATGWSRPTCKYWVAGAAVFPLTTTIQAAGSPSGPISTATMSPLKA